MSNKPTAQPDAHKPRAPAKPSDETLALRALRRLRELSKAATSARLAYDARVKALNEETAALLTEMSPSVSRLVTAMQKATEPAKDEKAQ